MAQKTVIEELIVTLGLDPKNFKKGEKEAAAALIDLKNQSSETNKKVQGDADKTGGSMMTLAKRVAGVVVVFKTLKWATQNILEMSRATYDLTNASRLLGEAPRMLRNFENVGEMFGSTADAVRKSVQGIKQAVHDLAFNGQMSQQLVQLGRLGVAFQDARGRPREFKDIAMDTAGALHRQIASGNMSESDALMMASSAGFDDGLSRAMVGGPDALALALAKQEGRRQVSPADVAAATANEQAITGAGQAKDTAFTAAQTAASGFITRSANVVEGAYTGGATGDASVAWDAWTKAIEPLTTDLGDFADGLKDATGAAVDWANKVAGRSRGLRNNNPGNIRALPGQTADEEGFRIYPTMDAGIVGMSEQLDRYAGRGKNTIRDIVSTWAPSNENDTAGYISNVSQFTGIAADAQLTASDRAQVMAAMMRQENGRSAPGSADVADVLGMTDARGVSPLQSADAAISARAPSGGGGSTTSVQIDQITVVTAATDANGIAGSIADATRRKLSAAQADQGMR